MLNKWTIGGVPEHFNLPWQDVIDHFVPDSGHGPSGLVWRGFAGGTGAMIESLTTGGLDIAILLTEGAVAGIARGADYAIVSNYVTSPLIWGVHVAGTSSFDAVEGLGQARFAISRFGSGSHLMAHALAAEQGWALDPAQFVVVGSLDGAVEALNQRRADVFMWERFMTQPLVDRGVFRRVGEFMAPWSAFVTCANQAVWSGARADVESLVSIVGLEAQRFAADPSTPARVARTFGLGVARAREWLSRTRWAEGPDSPAEDIEAAGKMLRVAGVIGSERP